MIAIDLLRIQSSSLCNQQLSSIIDRCLRVMVPSIYVDPPTLPPLSSIDGHQSIVNSKDNNGLRVPSSIVPTLLKTMEWYTILHDHRQRNATLTRQTELMMVPTKIARQRTRQQSVARHMSTAYMRRQQRLLFWIMQADVDAAKTTGAFQRKSRLIAQQAPPPSPSLRTPIQSTLSSSTVSFPPSSNAPTTPRTSIGSSNTLTTLQTTLSSSQSVGSVGVTSNSSELSSPTSTTAPTAPATTITVINTDGAMSSMSNDDEANTRVAALSAAVLPTVTSAAARAPLLMIINDGTSEQPLPSIEILNHLVKRTTRAMMVSHVHAHHFLSRTVELIDILLICSAVSFWDGAIESKPID
jgi:hypothetical protein